MEAIESAVLTSYANPLARLWLGQEGPLVSVIVRTTGRRETYQALESLARQLYRPIEVVLVDARGQGVPPEKLPEGLEVRWVPSTRPLRRSEASNVGLGAAKGQFVGFLDEDDFLACTHILRLVAALLANPHYLVAYSSTVTVGRSGGEILFAKPFSRARLLTGNFIPIHAALFSRRALLEGCAFDETLDCFEDWDFRLQLAERGSFLWVPAVTAFYRASGSSGVGAAACHGEPPSGWRRVQEKWARKADGPGWDEQAAKELAALEAALAKKESHLATVEARLAAAEAELMFIKTSRSWRWTAPFRVISRKLRGHKGPRLEPADNTVSVGFAWLTDYKPLPLISVILPCYNVQRSEEFLREAITSVEQQVYPDVELVVVDDGSTDETFSVACRLVEHLSIPARVLRKANGGQSSARNVGAVASRGEWLAFLDQDDAYYPERFTAVFPYLGAQTNLVYTDADTMRADGTTLWVGIHRNFGCGGPHPIGSAREAMTRDVFVVPGVMTVRTAAFRAVGGFDERLSGYEDDDLFVRLCQLGGVNYVPVSTLRWRMHASSASQSHRMVQSRIRYWDKLMGEVGRIGDRELAKEVNRRFVREFARQALWSLKDGSPVFESNVEGLERALERVPLRLRLPYTFFLLPWLWLARRLPLLRRLIRTPREGWDVR